MKIVTYIFLVVTLLMGCKNSQTVNTSVNQPVDNTSQTKAFIIFPRQHVLYTGIENLIEVVNDETGDYTVSGINATVKKVDHGYVVSPHKGRTAILVITSKDGVVLSRNEYRVKNIPDPKPYFGGITGNSNITKAKLLAAQGVIAKLHDFEYDVKFKIISFSAIANVNGKMIELKTRSERLSVEMKSLFNNINAGDYLFITNIKAKGPDGTIRDLGSISLKVI